MGRAIDMEKDIDILKHKLQKLENIVKGMSHTMSQTKHIDIIEETKEKKTNGKKKSNNEGNDGSSGKSNKRKANSVSKANKS